MSDHYKLVDRKPVPCTLEEFAAMYLDHDSRRVGYAELDGGVTVSTVFLGLDHNWGYQGAPVLFETMIFGGGHDQYQKRYCTWDEAELGHKRAVRIATGEETEDETESDE